MNSYKELLGYIRPYFSKVVLNIFSNLMVAALTVFSIPLIIPFFSLLFGEKESRQLIDLGDKTNWINEMYVHLIAYFGNQNAVLIICGMLVLVYLIKNVFRYLSMTQLTTLKNAIVRDLREKVYHKILNLPLAYYSEERKGNIMSRFSADVQEIDNSILSVLESFVKSPLILLGSIGYMLYLSPLLTAFVFVMLLVTVFIIGTISKTLKKKSHTLQARMGQLLSLLEETLGGIKIVKGFQAEGYLSQHFGKQITAYRSLADKVGMRRDLSSPLSEVLSVTVIAAIMVFGSSLVLKDILGPAEFFSFLLAFFYILEPSKALSSAYYNLQKGMAATERITAFLATENTVKERDTAIKNFKFDQSIVFESVDFQYPGSSIPVLRGVELSIPKGKMVALVGASGAGKSTLADLLFRFYDVTQGAIKIDGTDVRDYGLNALRSKMGLVTQEPILFNDSIANNIVFGMENVSEQEIVEAAKSAYAHDFIEALPQGYQTLIGDRGLKLSGGQRQRLTIARALLKNPEILILDEATSALDTESERWVQAALAKIMRGRTSLVIAHRLSTIQEADLIYVLDQGVVKEKGDHLSLMKQGGMYAQFISSQSF
jgi:ABC-type multidrug transport system fused ATPase/permease subunit